MSNLTILILLCSFAVGLISYIPIFLIREEHIRRIAARVGIVAFSVSTAIAVSDKLMLVYTVMSAMGLILIGLTFTVKAKPK